MHPSLYNVLQANGEDVTWGRFRKFELSEDYQELSNKEDLFEFLLENEEEIVEIIDF